MVYDITNQVIYIINNSPVVVIYKYNAERAQEIVIVLIRKSRIFHFHLMVGSIVNIIQP